MMMMMTEVVFLTCLLDSDLHERQNDANKERKLVHHDKFSLLVILDQNNVVIWPMQILVIISYLLDFSWRGDSI